jgi:hypothetical protein
VHFLELTGDSSTEALFCQQLYLRQECGFATGFCTDGVALPGYLRAKQPKRWFLLK